MGRTVAVLWHASFSIAAGVLYFFFVLPRWPELMGDTTHGLGTTLRIVTGVLIGLAALPVVFTQLRTRAPELGTPQLALSVRTGSTVAHVLAGVLIVGAAISENWVSLDTAGQWLFAVYGAAAAIAVLGIFSFYLSFVAELPPKPAKPKEPKAAKERRRGRRRGRKADDAADIEDTEAAEAEGEAEEAPGGADAAAETVAASIDEPAVSTAETENAPAAEDDDVSDEVSDDVSDDPEGSQGALRNRRPTGKTSHRMRRPRRSTQAGE